MLDLVSVVLFTFPLVLAAWVGAKWSRMRFLWGGLVMLVLVSAFPIAHWYILRFLRFAFLDLTFKSEVVAASVSGMVMLWEIPLCTFAYSVWRLPKVRKPLPKPAR